MCSPATTCGIAELVADGHSCQTERVYGADEDRLAGRFDSSRFGPAAAAGTTALQAVVIGRAETTALELSLRGATKGLESDCARIAKPFPDNTQRERPKA